MANKMRLVFLTLEYKAGTFSGNGVYSQSMVRSLAQLGHSVLVISAAPPAGWGSKDSETGINAPNAKPIRGKVDVEAALLEVEVPVWGRLDWRCGWQEFAAGISSDVVTRILDFNPEWALVVDWSAMEAFKKAVHSPLWKGSAVPTPPMAYLNYRIYTLSEYQGEEGQKERAFYHQKESEAVSQASAIAGLNTRDSEYLATELGQQKHPRVTAQALLPPLREDIRILAIAAQNNKLAADQGTDATGNLHKAVASWPDGRKYLACCVRLSPEKNAVLFAVIVEKLASFLQEQGITPLICAGAGGRTQYALDILTRVKSAAPNALIVDGFMGPAQMIDIYSRTLLNIHPCLYDAYGMTIVEAAAAGAPSVVHKGPGGAVGAAELLNPDIGLSIPANLGNAKVDQMIDTIQEALVDPRRLAEVGVAAAAMSLSWSEEANAKQLTKIIVEAKEHVKQALQVSHI